MRRQPRRRPDPTKIKKSSQLRKSHDSAVRVVGDRERTSTGYRIPGFRGKKFETIYEVMLAGSSTDLLMHPTKDRTMRVLEGNGYAVVAQEDGSLKQYRLSPGDEVAFEAKQPYRIATGGLNLAVLFSQEAKYDSRLQVQEEQGAEVVVPQALLDGLTMDQKRSAGIPSPRRGSKAVQQQLASRGQQIQHKETGGTAEPAAVATHFSGSNLKPIANFSEDGAG